MKIENWQLATLVIGAFAVVVALDILVQYQGNAEFATKFPKMPTNLFAKRAAGDVAAQEMQEPIRLIFPTIVPDEDEGN